MPRIADAVIVFDERQKEIHQEFGIAAERIHVVAPGLDLNEMSKPDEHWLMLGAKNWDQVNGSYTRGTLTVIRI